MNTDTGEFVALALDTGFRFQNTFMEKHFNENYAESDIYPKATFRGNIKDFKLNSSEKNYEITGTLTLHGKMKILENSNVTILVTNNKIKLTGLFTTKASDFDIEIPKIVSNKISEYINVTFEFGLLGQ